MSPPTWPAPTERTIPTLTSATTSRSIRRRHRCRPTPIGDLLVEALGMPVRPRATALAHPDRRIVLGRHVRSSLHEPSCRGRRDLGDGRDRRHDPRADAGHPGAGTHADTWTPDAPHWPYEAVADAVAGRVACGSIEVGEEPAAPSGRSTSRAWRAVWRASPRTCTTRHRPRQAPGSGDARPTTVREIGRTSSGSPSSTSVSPPEHWAPQSTSCSSPASPGLADRGHRGVRRLGEAPGRPARGRGHLVRRTRSASH